MTLDGRCLFNDKRLENKAITCVTPGINVLVLVDKKETLQKPGSNLYCVHTVCCASVPLCIEAAPKVTIQA